jgi:hypothetical protein
MYIAKEIAKVDIERHENNAFRSCLEFSHDLERCGEIIYGN